MSLARLVPLLSLVFLPALASGATVAAVFGGRVPCAERAGVQFCEGGPAPQSIQGRARPTATPPAGRGNAAGR